MIAYLIYRFRMTFFCSLRKEDKKSHPSTGIDGLPAGRSQGRRLPRNTRRPSELAVGAVNGSGSRRDLRWARNHG
jgi:hypothetical protein